VRTQFTLVTEVVVTQIHNIYNTNMNMNYIDKVDGPSLYRVRFPCTLK
jgi:hypothetical protein